MVGNLNFDDGAGSTWMVQQPGSQLTAATGTGNAERYTALQDPLNGRPISMFCGRQRTTSQSKASSIAALAFLKQSFRRCELSGDDPAEVEKSPPRRCGRAPAVRLISGSQGAFAKSFLRPIRACGQGYQGGRPVSMRSIEDQRRPCFKP